MAHIILWWQWYDDDKEKQTTQHHTYTHTHARTLANVEKKKYKTKNIERKKKTTYWYTIWIFPSDFITFSSSLFKWTLFFILEFHFEMLFCLLSGSVSPLRFNAQDQFFSIFFSNKIFFLLLSAYFFFILKLRTNYRFFFLYSSNLIALNICLLFSSIFFFNLSLIVCL